MKTNAEFTVELIKQAKIKRKRKRILIGAFTSFVLFAICFLIGFSNLVTVDFSLFANSYISYLKPYASTEGDYVGLQIVDDKSAVVSLENAVYPCTVNATSKTEFDLVPVEAEGERQEDAPSVFRVEFWDDSATVSWELYGVKLEKVLNITQTENIPAGLWSLFAVQDGNSSLQSVSGAGWTLILENGESYSGEGYDAARTKFISMGERLFQCSFDPISGIILDASIFEYDETSFSYPVIKERYLSDGDEFYFYSKLLSDEEKIDFEGGEFYSSAFVYESENHRIKKSELLDESVAEWKPYYNTSQEKAALDLSAQLILDENGSVRLTVGKDGAVATYGGFWYPLKHSVLVVLDKKNPITGRLFTLFVGDYSGVPTGELIQKYAMSRIQSIDCYKTGYHTFDYFIFESETEIYWGKEWTPDCYTPRLEYETEYVLYGKYFKDYYDGDWSSGEVYKDGFQFDESWLVDLPVNGAIFVFHEDGTVNVTFPDGRTDHDEFELSFDGLSVSLRWGIDLHIGERAIKPNNPGRPNRNLIVHLSGLTVSVTGLYKEYGSSYGWVDEETGKSMIKSVIYYDIMLEKKLKE